MTIQEIRIIKMQKGTDVQDALKMLSDMEKSADKETLENACNVIMLYRDSHPGGQIKSADGIVYSSDLDDFILYAQALRAIEQIKKKKNKKASAAAAALKDELLKGQDR